MREERVILKRRCEALLHEWGVSPYYKGYSYLVDAVVYGGGKRLTDAIKVVSRKRKRGAESIYYCISHALKMSNLTAEKMNTKHRVLGVKAAQNAVLTPKDVYSSLLIYTKDEYY